jgi:hypothetical protein
MSDTEDVNRFVDVLDLLSPEIIKVEGEHSAHIRVGSCGNGHASWLSEAFQSGCNVHPFSKDVAALDHYVTDMYSDPELETPLLGHILA